MVLFFAFHSTAEDIRSVLFPFFQNTIEFNKKIYKQNVQIILKDSNTYWKFRWNKFKIIKYNQLYPYTMKRGTKNRRAPTPPTPNNFPKFKTNSPTNKTPDRNRSEKYINSKYSSGQRALAFQFVGGGVGSRRQAASANRRNYLLFTLVYYQPPFPRTMGGLHAKFLSLLPPNLRHVVPPDRLKFRVARFWRARPAMHPETAQNTAMQFRRFNKISRVSPCRFRIQVAYLVGIL